MRELLNQLATNRRLGPMHLRVAMFVMANGPNADLGGLEGWSKQAVNQGAAYMVTLGVIVADPARSTFSLANSEHTSEQLIPPSNQPVEIPETESIDEDAHKFLRRPWAFEQQPALQAWNMASPNDRLLEVAFAAAIHDKLDHPDLEAALDIAEKWALRVIPNEESA